MTDLNRSGPLFEQIYEVLWARILSGEIRHGARISDLDLSKKLNVSRTPVREAIRKLQQDGILVQLDRGGCEIRRMDANDLGSLYRCRAALEGLAAREAATNGTKRQISRLSDVVEKTGAALDERKFESTFELNTQFHSTILSMAQNAYLEHLLLDLRRMILFARSSLMIAANQPEATEEYREHLERVQNDHRAILAAIAAGDPDAAAARMQKHLFSTADDMVALATTLSRDG